jgi:hypothetical protein
LDCWYRVAAADQFGDHCWLALQEQYREQWLFNVDHGQPHRDTAEQHGLRLVIAATDHPGAIEERHAVAR